MKTTEKFITEAKEVHGNKYDYSKVEYVNSATKVCIICLEHGEFWQQPNNHLKGSGCPKCGKETSQIRNKELSKKASIEFEEKARAIHGGKYDYSKVEYINNKTKVCIICPKHGEFWIQPNNHLNGQGCRKCSIEEQRMPKDEFIEKCRKIHGDKYDYSKVEFTNNKEKVCIICPTHGEFWQKVNNHLNGHECPKCAHKKRRETIKEKLGISQEQFIERAIEVHGNKYDYSKVEYINGDTKVCIICPTHGEFWQTPYSHTRANQGCPICNESKLEKEIRLLLTDNSIDFTQQKKFDWLGLQSLDFYLPQYNVAIECQGIQHFELVEYFGGENEFNKRKINDRRKKELCDKNGIKLLYYTNFLCEESKNMCFSTNEILEKINECNMEKS